MKCQYCGFEWDEQPEERFCPLCGEAIPECMLNLDIPDSLQPLLEKANNKDGEAQYSLGNLYYFGIEVDQNPEKAFCWFEKAAQNHFIDAEFALGRCYQTESGVKADEEKAKEWYLKAAGQGYAPAMNNYGLLLVKNGKSEAGMDYLKQAVQLGNDAAANNSIVLSYISKEMSFEDAKTNLENISKSFSPAVFNLGILLYDKAENSDDYETVFKYFEEASDFNLRACLYSGICFLCGFECKQDFEIARQKLKAYELHSNVKVPRWLEEFENLTKELSWIQYANQSKEEYLKTLRNEYKGGKIKAENATEMNRLFREMMNQDGKINYAAALKLRNYYFELFGIKKETGIGEIESFVAFLANIRKEGYLNAKYFKQGKNFKTKLFECLFCRKVTEFHHDENNHFKINGFQLVTEEIKKTKRVYYPHYQNRIERDPKRQVSWNAPCPCGSGKKYKHCCGK